MPEDSECREIQDFLDEIAHIREEHPLDEMRRRSYSVFNVLGLSEDERAMCRVLADLLDPEGSHGQGALFLRSFIKRVLRLRPGDMENIDGLRVFRERDANGRRIDITIEGPGTFIPIEAKIWAGDQQAQCFDYLAYARRHDHETKLYYLKPCRPEREEDAWPSGRSLKAADGTDALRREDVVPIFFKEDIVPWLESVASLASEQVAGGIRQYITAIKSFTERIEGEYGMDIVNQVLKNEENLSIARDIINSADAIKVRLVRLVFDDIKKAMGELTNKLPIEYVRKGNDYFGMDDQALARSSSTYPGLSYLVSGRDTPGPINLCLGIQLDSSFFAGFYLCDKETKKQIGSVADQLKDEALRKSLATVLDLDRASFNRNSSWVCWLHLPDGEMRAPSGTAYPLALNDAAISLCDQDKRDQFVKASIATIKEKLLGLLV